jgi:hypothetical protein
MVDCVIEFESRLECGVAAMGTTTPVEKRLGSNGSGKSGGKNKTEARDGS